ncbi:hypothetical protein DFH07DRAFT_785485 [Mycena maculata]|uniref:Uncharacterized protein n=1 Tax=Mycena maculata TaxID=230809 RepID=A0AAD7MG33_9AGAR|nr:hypothetical protein DFH07DRAFT_785485 [Mycena maculata]
MGWSSNRLTRDQTKFSQAWWYRTCFFMNTEQMSLFSRLTGKYLVDAWSAIKEARLTYIRENQHSDADGLEEAKYVGDGDEEPVEDIRLPSTFMQILLIVLHSKKHWAL